MARASGLALVGGADGNDPIAATTYGTGELIAAALDAGAQRGSSSASAARPPPTAGSGPCGPCSRPHRLRGVELLVACDVRTRFVDAAAVFAPQKGAIGGAGRAARAGASNAWPRSTVEDYGVDVLDLDGGGAAGGLAGGLATLGADLVPGFDVVADELDLAERIEAADLVVTGEGFLDAQSFEGKVVGGVTRAGRAGGHTGARRGRRGVRRLRRPGAGHLADRAVRLRGGPLEHGRLRRGGRDRPASAARLVAQVEVAGPDQHDEQQQRVEGEA